MPRRRNSILDNPLMLSLLSWPEIEDLLLSRALSPPEDPLLDASSFDPDRFKELFRFEQDDMHELLDGLRMPDEVTSSQGVTVSDAEALCMTLRRLAYPTRLRELEALFHHDGSVIASVVGKVLSHVDYYFSHLLADMTTHRWLAPTDLERFAKAVHAKGSALSCCWGFVDSTVRRIYRQSSTGHVRCYKQKYQAVMSANGIVCQLNGPYPEWHHDCSILRLSSLYSSLETLAEGRRLLVYGRGRYPLRPLLMRPYEGGALKPHEALFNHKMAVVQRPVEYALGRLADELSVVRFHKSQAFSRQHLTRMYRVATLLANCHACLYGNPVSAFFGVEPPTLEEYLVPLPSDVE